MKISTENGTTANKAAKGFKWKKWVAAGAAVLLVAIVGFNCFTVVEAGHTGVVVTLGRVNEGVLQEGIHGKAPFVQDVIKIDNRIQKLEVNTEAFSKDLQSVKTVLAINYRVDTSKSYSIYKNIGADYENVLVVPAVNEVLKAITARYTAEESVTNRALISDGLVVGLNEKLNELGLYVTDVNIIDHGDRRKAGRAAAAPEGGNRKADRHHQRAGSGGSGKNQGGGRRRSQQKAERIAHRQGH